MRQQVVSVALSRPRFSLAFVLLTIRTLSGTVPPDAHHSILAHLGKQGAGRKSSSGYLDVNCTKEPGRTAYKEIIMFTDIRIGQPARFGSLTVFPLLSEEIKPVDYLLSDVAMATGTVTVSEVSQQGSVPDLTVENKGERRALFLEGEQLIGSKQNRILNTSVLVPALAKLKIPVSCVEHGRWHRTTAFFSSSKVGSPYRLRYGLKGSVTRSLREKRGHRSDQTQVWEDVRKQQESLGVSSDTSALNDTFDKYEKNLAEAKEALQYIAGACGLAIALGSKIVTIDLFDKPATCEKVWSRLLSGIVLDALVEGPGGDSPEQGQLAQLLDEVQLHPWTKTATVGEGQEFRTEFDGKVGSALMLDGSLVHGSVICAV
jgi:hypothetical protein